MAVVIQFANGLRITYLNADRFEDWTVKQGDKAIATVSHLCPCVVEAGNPSVRVEMVVETRMPPQIQVDWTDRTKHPIQSSFWVRFWSRWG